MGKRKQRKNQEEQKTKQKSDTGTRENQENVQVKGNYLTPNKRDKEIDMTIAKQEVKCLEKEEANANSKTSAQSKGPANVTKVSEQSLISAPSCEQKDHFQSNNMISIAIDGSIKPSQTRVPLKKQRQDSKLVDNSQPQTANTNQNLKTLLQSQKQLTKQVEPTTKGDSGLDEEEYGDEDYDQNQIPFQLNGNTQTAASNNFYYDEVEATQYSQNITDTSLLQQQMLPRNLNHSKNRQLVKDIQQLSMETLIKSDEQIQSDIKFCLYCIYNNHDIAQYFQQLLRVQRKLKEWKSQLSREILFSLFEDNIKEFMHGIRDKLIDEMRQQEMIKQKPSPRRYSFDDYFLIDKTFSRSYSIHGYNNEILHHCMKYMLDSKYEAIRNDLRHRIWNEMRKNNEVIVSFYQDADAYQKIFDLLIRFYTRVRDSVIGIEEMWVFFMESVFPDELQGVMIFEQFHKDIFKKDILNHRYIQSFLKEINEVQIDLDNRRQTNQTNDLDAIIENISQILFELNEDLKSQIEIDLQRIEKSKTKEKAYKPYQVDEMYKEDDEEDEVDDESDTEVIVTYQQLQWKIKQQYGGLSLAQQVEQHSSQSSNHHSILQSIQQEKRCQELMKNLPNLDTDTLCYIIENKLSRKDFEAILLQNQSKIQRPSTTNISDEEMIQDDVIISPSKNLNFLNQYFHYAAGADHDGGDYNNSISDDDEDEAKNEKQVEKKKKKNMKKKRKRKQKKILAQLQDQLEEKLKHKLLEEQQKRGFTNDNVRSQLRKKLIQHLGIDQTDVEQYLTNYSLRDDNSKKTYSVHSSSHQNSQDSFQNELHTKQTQCDDNSDHDLDQEIEFEKDLELFRQRLESFNQAPNWKNKPKLVPNIPAGWIDKLRQSYNQCQSPKQSDMMKAKVQYGNHSEGLWVKSYQHSA